MSGLETMLTGMVETWFTVGMTATTFAARKTYTDDNGRTWVAVGPRPYVAIHWGSGKERAFGSLTAARRFGKLGAHGYRVFLHLRPQRRWRPRRAHRRTPRVHLVTPETTLPAVALDPDLARKLRTAGRKVAQATAERDRLVRDARDAGGSLREIGELVGLTHTAVRFIAHGRPAR